MGNARELAERFWNSTADTVDLSPWSAFQGLEEIADGVAFVGAFGNVIAVRTGEGMVVVDTSAPLSAPSVLKSLQAWCSERLHTVVYTHGHVDHVGGMPFFDRVATEAGGPKPTVIAHENVRKRFARYQLTAGFQGYINQRQFQVPRATWPTTYRQPDIVYRNEYELLVGKTRFVLCHDKGETDDHTWLYLPETRTLCTGDFFIWASPNCGNPQKVQRYPIEWAKALRRMAGMEAEILLPGHGPLIVGADRVQQALNDTAELLETLHDQTVEHMNQGHSLDEVVQRVKPPAALMARPYLRPIYDEPAFIVRNLWRLYGGWYDGNPAHLKPAPNRALAEEVARATGGVSALIERARALMSTDDLALACHFAEWAFQAASEPERKMAAAARAEIYELRSSRETSLMARNIFAAAVRESRKIGGEG